MKIQTAALCVWLAGTATILAGELRWQSPASRRVSLIELYTSEGCSSCPPAEAWFSGLAASPRLWKDFVPVSFHVDYWDNLGWRDRFASPAWTRRQREYASRWGADTVYTPGFVRDGAEWQRSGDAPSAAEFAISAGTLSATVKDGRDVTVTYQPAAGRRAVVALLGFGLNTSVKAGENRGRALRHDFVALSCETKILAGGAAEFTLPSNPEGAAVAVWIENPATGAVEQATGGWLRPRP